MTSYVFVGLSFDYIFQEEVILDVIYTVRSPRQPPHSRPELSVSPPLSHSVAVALRSVSPFISWHQKIQLL